MELKYYSSKTSFGDFNKLSIDEINFILTFLGNDVSKMIAVSIDFHTIIQTTPAFTTVIDKKCDCLLSQVVLLLPHISPSENNTLDILYSVIMKKPMSNIEQLEKVMSKCQIFLHGMILNILCQLELFENHYQNQYLLVEKLAKQFINEGLERLTIIDATFSCIADLIKKTNDTSEKMIVQIDSARDDIIQQSNDGTTAQQGLLMRLATAISLSWDLMDSSQMILHRNLKSSHKLIQSYQKIQQFYEKFINGRVLLKVRPKEFKLIDFTQSITQSMREMSSI